MPGLSRAARGIPLHNRAGMVVAFTIVDADDHASFGRFNWSLTSNRYVRRRRPGGSQVRLHRELCGLDTGDGLDVDHLNGDKLDNRRANLRVATRAQNHQNRRKITGRSPFRGVSYDRARGKWKAAATLNYRPVFIGRFDTEEAAAAAAAAWRAEHMPFSTN